MRILLTGCSGRLGIAILQEAERFGRENNLTLDFVGVDITESTFPAVEFHQGSFTDAELINRVLPGCDAVIHTAAYHNGYLKTHSPTEFVEVNAGGLTTLLEACVRHEVRRFVFSSTMEVLIGGDWAASGMQRLDESSPPRPQTIYSQSKLQCETLGQYYAAQKGIEFIALRYQNIDAAAASPLGLLARGVKAADAARCNLLGLIAPDICYEMMLIGPQTPLQNMDMIKAQSDPDGVIERYWPGATKVLSENNLQAQPRHFWPAVSVTKARHILHWQPEITFESWLRKHGWPGGCG